MITEQHSVKAIFLAALEKTTAAEQSAFLDQACAGDGALRQRVETLLRSSAQPDSLLDHPVGAAAAPTDVTLARIAHRVVEK